MDAVLRLMKEAEAADIVVEEDPVGAVMAPEAAAGKAWQDSAREVMTKLQVRIADQPRISLQATTQIQCRTIVQNCCRPVAQNHSGRHIV